MGTIYSLKELRKLEFQVDCQNVSMYLKITQNEGEKEYEYVISHSELNKILSRIQSDNSDIDLYEFIKIYTISEEQMLYSVNLERVKLNNAWITYYEFGGQYKEIRA